MIVEQIGTPALLEQTAEECCELAHACLKLARKLRDENPTPKKFDEIMKEVAEETADVQVCLDILTSYTDITDYSELSRLRYDKTVRWNERLNAAKNGKDI